MTSAWETLLWSQYLGRRPCLYFVNLLFRVWCRGSVYSCQLTVCIYITLCNSISSSVPSHWCWMHTSNFVWFITKVYRKQLCKGLSGTVLRKRLHFSLSMWLILVVWGPKQVFVFKSDVYQGTDCPGIIITGLSEMSCRARMSNGKRQSFALCFLTKFQRGCFHTFGTCGPNQNGRTVSWKSRVVILSTDWHRPELSYHSR